jgi:hypothetical protein
MNILTILILHIGHGHKSHPGRASYSSFISGFFQNEIEGYINICRT